MLQSSGAQTITFCFRLIPTPMTVARLSGGTRACAPMSLLQSLKKNVGQQDARWSQQLLISSPLYGFIWEQHIQSLTDPLFRGLSLQEVSLSLKNSDPAENISKHICIAAISKHATASRLNNNVSTVIYQPLAFHGLPIKINRRLIFILKVEFLFPIGLVHMYSCLSSTSAIISDYCL